MAFSMKIPARKKKKTSTISKPSTFYGLQTPSSPLSSSRPSFSTSQTPSHIKEMHTKALEQDANIFDYDTAYDQISAERKQMMELKQRVNKEEKKQSKYINTLLQTATERRLESEIIRERRLLNERKEQDSLYKDKERLVSASYKRKLEEMAQWRAKDSLQTIQDAREDVVKRGQEAMGTFYSNLRTKNIAMGANTETMDVNKQNIIQESKSIPQELKPKEETTEPEGIPPVKMTSESEDVPRTKEVTIKESISPKQTVAERIAAAKARYAARKQGN